MSYFYLFDIIYHYLSGTHFKSFANISSSAFFPVILLREHIEEFPRGHTTCDDINSLMANAMCACDSCT